MSAILLKNVGVDDSPCDILIEDGVIRNISRQGEGPVLKEVPASGVECVDCTGKAAFPGFYNMHTHAAMSLMRGVGEDIKFDKWLERIWQVEEAVDEEYVYWGTKVACLEMIRTGTITFDDFYWHIPAARQAALEMGMKAVHSYVMIDRNDPGTVARQKESFLELYEQSRTWEEGSFTAGFHAIYSTLEDTVGWIADFARDKGIRLHFHICETEEEVRNCKQKTGLSPIQYLDRLGALGPHSIAAHCLWLDQEDIDILGSRGVNCVHNINSNLKLASGYRFRYRELKEAGANICIGTDGCASSNNLDVLEALKTAALVQKAWRNDPTAMPLDELMAMATVNGAKALGRPDPTIRAGAPADLILVDTCNSFFLSPAPTLANFIYSAHSDCISSVICRGRFLMKDRKIDGEETIIENARRVMSRIL